MAGENLVRPKGLKAKIENFWYHYKFHTIALAVVFVTIVVSIAQCSTKIEYDYKIVLATENCVMTTAQLDAVQNELKRYGEDVNKDGEINIFVVDCTFDGNLSDHQSYIVKQQKLQALLMTDTSAMLFITDSKRFDWIDKLSKSGGFLENTGLPQNDGKSYDITSTHILEGAKKNADPEGKLIWPKELLISRRKIEETLFENKEGIDDAVKYADAFISRIIKANS